MPSCKPLRFRLAPSVRRGREASGARGLCASDSPGVPQRASKARADCGCRHGVTPNAMPGGKTFAVRRQLVGALKSTSKVGTHFCATPQFHAAWTGQTSKRPPGIPANRESRFSGVGSGASYPQRSLTPTNRVALQSALIALNARQPRQCAMSSALRRQPTNLGRSLLAPGDANIVKTSRTLLRRAKPAA